MPDTTTPNMGMIKPEIGGSPNTWGNKLNGNLDILDARAVKQTYQWKVALGDDVPGSATGHYIISRYGNDSIKIDEPLTINRQTGDITVANNFGIVKQFLASVGTALLPALSFLVEPTLGFYRSAAGKMTFTGRLFGNGVINPGFVMDFAGPTAPAGWLECDSSSRLVADFPDLFNAIGYTWGGSGPNFNLPPGNDRFRRSRGGSAGAVGTLQAHSILSHSHLVYGNVGAKDINHWHHMDFMSQACDRSLSHSHPVTAMRYSASVAGIGTGGVAVQCAQVAFSTDNAEAPNHLHQVIGDTGYMNANNAHDHLANFNSQPFGDAESRPLSMTMMACIKT